MFASLRAWGNPGGLSQMELADISGIAYQVIYLILVDTCGNTVPIRVYRVWKSASLDFKRLRNDLYAGARYPRVVGIHGDEDVRTLPPEHRLNGSCLLV